MGKKLVLDVGNCQPDFTAISTMIKRSFEADVVQAHGLADTLEILSHAKPDLVLVNRKLDRDCSDGIRIIEQIKSDSLHRQTPVMLITNLAEHQQAAIAAGAERGFGKLELIKPETKEKLARFLE